jgi:hypothetical protein
MVITGRKDWAAPELVTGRRNLRVQDAFRLAWVGVTQTRVTDYPVQRGTTAKVNLNAVMQTKFRCIAQPGSASALGAEGRKFKSCYTDQFSKGSDHVHQTQEVDTHRSHRGQGVP